MDKKPDRLDQSPYLKYSSLAFQLIAVLLLAYYLGKYLDNRFNAGNPKYFTVSLFLFMLGGYLYKIIKDLTAK